MSQRTTSWRAGVVASGLASLLLVSGVDAGWDVEILQSGERQIGAITLAYDGAGNPSIAYGDHAAGEVRLATKAGGGWSFETVDTLSPLTIDHAYDSGGRAAISYTSREGGEALYYAERVSGQWQVTTVALRYEYFTVNSLAFDGNDTPSIIYHKGNKLVFASRPGSSWLNETVATNVNLGEESLTYDANDVPHIAFVDRPTMHSDVSHLKLATRSGSSWNVETIVSSPPYPSNLKSPNLAFDPSTGDATVLFWVQDEPCGPYLARKTGGAWQVDQFELGQFGSNAYAYDATGTPFVAHRGCSSVTAEVLVARETAAGWSSELVESNAEVGYASPSLAFDPEANPALAYGKYTDAGLDLRFVGSVASCSLNVECDDGNECTDDACLGGACQNTAVIDLAACNGGLGLCCGGACSSPCGTDGDCADGDLCTDDYCYDPGICSAYCENVFDPANDPSCDVCVPTSSKEKGPRCTDGLDNDCDGLIDGDDPDC